MAAGFDGTEVFAQFSWLLFKGTWKLRKIWSLKRKFDFTNFCVLWILESGWGNYETCATSRFLERVLILRKLTSWKSGQTNFFKLELISPKYKHFIDIGISYYLLKVDCGSVHFTFLKITNLTLKLS